jgi:hypothetical protein
MAGIEFIPGNGGGPGVRLRKRATLQAEPAHTSKPVARAKTATREKTRQRPK